MPNCFQLYRNGTAVPLNIIDEEMCRYFSADCHPTRYFMAWYDWVGYFLAMGKTFDEIRALSRDGELAYLIEIIDWIEAHFQPTSWHEMKT